MLWRSWSTSNNITNPDLTVLDRTVRRSRFILQTILQLSRLGRHLRRHLQT
jgi:hypothetical protein